MSLSEVEAFSGRVSPRPNGVLSWVPDVSRFSRHGSHELLHETVPGSDSKDEAAIHLNSPSLACLDDQVGSHFSKGTKKWATRHKLT